MLKSVLGGGLEIYGTGGRLETCPTLRGRLETYPTFRGRLETCPTVLFAARKKRSFAERKAANGSFPRPNLA